MKTSTPSSMPTNVIVVSDVPSDLASTTTFDDADRVNTRGCHCKCGTSRVGRFVLCVHLTMPVFFKQILLNNFK